MTQAQLEIQLVAVIVAAACALPGVFLVLRRMAMMSDAISHAILPGIVVAFLFTHDLSSPLLLLGAAATGLLTVVLVEIIQRTRLVREDTAMGLVFPVLFSVGVILIARYADDVHLDTDAVLLGELAFTPFTRLQLMDIDLGPQSLWVMLVIGVLNALYIGIFYKELKLATFDPGLAAAVGFAPSVLHYSLMGLVSLTAVGAFDAVGSILVVALMIAPPATAYLLTDRLSRMIALSVGIGAAGAILGYWTAHWLDVSIAGSMASLSGVLFFTALVGSPSRGVFALARNRIRQRRRLFEHMLVVHLANHEGTPEADVECSLPHLTEHLQWSPERAAETVRRAQRKGLVVVDGMKLRLTGEGRAYAEGG